jgi:hypothetical protein
MEAATTKPALVVRLGGNEYPVQLPKRHAERRELATCWANANLRGAGAVLAVCVPSLGVLRSRENPQGLDPAAFGYNWYEFGAEALDLLLSRGLAEMDVLRESVPVFNAIAALLLPSQGEVNEARDFSKGNAGT